MMMLRYQSTDEAFDTDTADEPVNETIPLIQQHYISKGLNLMKKFSQPNTVM